MADESANRAGREARETHSISSSAPLVAVRLIRLGPNYDVVVNYPGQPEIAARVDSRSLYDVVDAAVDTIEAARSDEQVEVTWTLEGAQGRPSPIAIDRVGSTLLPTNLPLWGRN